MDKSAFFFFFFQKRGVIVHIFLFRWTKDREVGLALHLRTEHCIAGSLMEVSLDNRDGCYLRLGKTASYIGHGWGAIVFTFCIFSFAR